MAYNRFARKKKTPFGKVITEKKPSKPKKTKAVVVVPPKYHMAFCLMTLAEGVKSPSDEEQLEFVKKSIKEKSILTKTTFAELPVVTRTIAFRIEKWIDSGDLFVVRVAKSVYSAECGRVVYVCVKKSVFWKLK